MQQRWNFVFLACLAFGLAACGSGEACPFDADPCPTDEDMGDLILPDAGPPDLGVDEGPVPECSPDRAGSGPGAACRRGTECDDGSRCNEQLDLTFAGSGFAITQYPDSLCGDECNPDVANTCGSCALCADYTVVGRLRFPNFEVQPGGAVTALNGVCRQVCEANVDDNGGCRTGYTCDIESFLAPANEEGAEVQFCVEACRNDGDCNVDGATLEVDPFGPWSCNRTTGRCEHPGTEGVSAGDPCSEDTDCMANGECIGDPGFCIRRGCADPDFACGEAEICTQFGVGANSSACAVPCTVGAEPVEDRLGVDGGGDTCATGQSCVWAGDTASTAGACLTGNYNDITTPNLGVPCSEDADCYSPYGYGRCLTTQTGQPGFCSIANCLTGGDDEDEIIPGVDTGETSVCPVADGNICANFGDLTFFCLTECDDAEDCGGTSACNEDILASGDRICWDTCGGAAGDDGSDDCALGYTCRGEETNAICEDGEADCSCRLNCSSDADCGEGRECVTGEDADPCEGEECFCQIVEDE
ncbi:MAG: hypothetical protein ACFCGT_25940 [Sandaracinaceae bacterium]